MATSDYWSSADLKNIESGGLINEDVMQQIWNISRIPLPFMDVVGVGSPVSNSYTEWTTDEQATPDQNNAEVDGSDIDVTENDAAGGARVGNHCQISTKLVITTDRANNSDTIGRANELAYQLMMRQQDLMRDLEVTALTPQASVADDGNTTPGRVGGFPSWLATNALRSGSSGGFNNSTKLVDAPTAGTSRALDFQDHFEELVEDVYLENGDPTTIMSVPGLIRRMNNYALSNPTAAGIATPTANVSGTTPVDQTLQKNVAVYRTDFGFTMRATPNRIQATYDSGDATPVPVADLFLITPGMVEFAYLQAPRTRSLGRNGTAERRQIAVDWTIRVKNEKAHGVISELDPTAAVT